MRKQTFLSAIVLMACAMAVRFPAFAANDLPKELAIADELAKPIIEHMPTKAAVTPEKPRKLLVYIQADQFRTPGEPYVSRALKVMAEKTAAFTVDYSTDIKVFLPEKLNQYDAFLLNSTVNMPVSPERTPEICKSIMDFVKGGKGAIGIHGAVDDFRNWPEAQEMLGNLFRGHPWGRVARGPSRSTSLATR